MQPSCVFIGPWEIEQYGFDQFRRYGDKTEKNYILLSFEFSSTDHIL
jgi:hypothetical protein